MSKTFYNYPLLLELLEAERLKYKKDFTAVNKDVEKQRVAIVIVNALNEAKSQTEEIIGVIEEVTGAQ